MDSHTVEDEALLELLLSDARTLGPRQSLQRDQPIEEYIAQIYDLMALRMKKTPLHQQAWILLAQYVRTLNWTLMREIYGLFSQLQSQETHQVYLVTQGRGISQWHLKTCLYVWLQGRSHTQRLTTLIQLRCFLNLTPHEAEARLRRESSAGVAPYLYRLSTTKAGQLTLSFTLPFYPHPIMHMRYEVESVQRLALYSDLYEALLREQLLKLNSPPTLRARDVIVLLKLFDYGSITEQRVIIEFGPEPYESEKIPQMCRMAFYPLLETVQVRAQSTNELIGLTQSYVQAYEMRI